MREQLPANTATKIDRHHQFRGKSILQENTQFVDQQSLSWQFLTLHFRKRFDSMTWFKFQRSTTVYYRLHDVVGKNAKVGKKCTHGRSSEVKARSTIKSLRNSFAITSGYFFYNSTLSKTGYRWKGTQAEFTSERMTSRDEFTKSHCVFSMRDAPARNGYRKKNSDQKWMTKASLVERPSQLWHLLLSILLRGAGGCSGTFSLRGDLDLG